MPRPFVNLDDLEFNDIEDNGYYTSKRALFSKSIGARKLGYNLTELPPGKAQCPFHSHRQEEEMFLVLDGQGSCASAISASRSASTTSLPARQGTQRWRNRSSTPGRCLCATWRCRTCRTRRSASTPIPAKWASSWRHRTPLAFARCSVARRALTTMTASPRSRPSPDISRVTGMGLRR